MCVRVAWILPTSDGAGPEESRREGGKREGETEVDSEVRGSSRRTEKEEQEVKKKRTTEVTTCLDKDKNREALAATLVQCVVSTLLLLLLLPQLCVCACVRVHCLPPTIVPPRQGDCKGVKEGRTS